MRGSCFGKLGCFGILVLLLCSNGVISGRPSKELEKAKQEASEEHRPVAFDVEAQTPVGRDQHHVAPDGGAPSSIDPRQLLPVDSVESGSTEETSSLYHSGSGNGAGDSQGEPGRESPTVNNVKYPTYSPSEKQKGSASTSGSCSSTSHGTDASASTSYLTTSSPNSEPAHQENFLEREREREREQEQNFLEREREQEQQPKNVSYQMLSIIFDNREAMDKTHLEGVVSLVLLASCLRDIGRVLQKPWILQLTRVLETAAFYILATQLIPSSLVPYLCFIFALIFLLFGGTRRT